MINTERPIPGADAPAEPVGHQGARVDITQPPALAITGWAGIVAMIAVGWWFYSAVNASSGWTWLPILLFVLVVTSLVVVPPGQSYLIQFFGTTSAPSASPASGGCCH